MVKTPFTSSRPVNRTPLMQETERRYKSLDKKTKNIHGPLDQKVLSLEKKHGFDL